MFYIGIKSPQEFAEGLYNIPYSTENQKYPNNLYADSHNHLAKKKKIVHIDYIKLIAIHFGSVKTQQ